MTGFYDSNIKCTVYLKKNGALEYNIKWSYLVTDFLEFLYDKFSSDWVYVDTFNEDGRPYGRLRNNQDTLSLVGQTLKKYHFYSIVSNVFRIDCELYLKSEPDNPRFYTVTNEELLNDFIMEINNLHGKDWNYFETYFNDSQEIAYGRIKNDSRLRKINKLTASGLKKRRWNINKSLWEDEFGQKNEKFYFMFFDNPDFLKIGHTFRNIEYRLYNYVFPHSDYEKSVYKNSIIDYEKSFLIETTIKQCDIKDELMLSFEKKVKDKFEKYTLSSKSEHLKKECYDDITSYLKREVAKNTDWKISKIAKQIGFKNSNEMKEKGYGLPRLFLRTKGS